MSSTRSVMWCRPGPRFSTYFAIGESGAVASSSSSFGVADRQEMRAHALRRDLLGRLDLEPERVAIERERRRQILDGDADVIENGFHELTEPRKHEKTSFMSCVSWFRS